MFSATALNSLKVFILVFHWLTLYYILRSSATKDLIEKHLTKCGLEMVQTVDLIVEIMQSKWLSRYNVYIYTIENIQHVSSNILTESKTNVTQLGPFVHSEACWQILPHKVLFLQRNASPLHQARSAHARLRLSNLTGIMTMECWSPHFSHSARKNGLSEPIS